MWSSFADDSILRWTSGLTCRPQAVGNAGVHPQLQAQLYSRAHRLLLCWRGLRLRLRLPRRRRPSCCLLLRVPSSASTSRLRSRPPGSACAGPASLLRPSAISSSSSCRARSLPAQPAGSAWFLRIVYTKRGDSAPMDVLESVYHTHIQVYNATYSAVRKVVAAHLQPTCAVQRCAFRAVYACFRTRGECERGTHLLSGMASPGKGASGLAAVLSPARALALPPFPGCAQSSRPIFASVPGNLLWSFAKVSKLMKSSWTGALVSYSALNRQGVRHPQPLNDGPQSLNQRRWHLSAIALQDLHVLLLSC